MLRYIFKIKHKIQIFYNYFNKSYYSLQITGNHYFAADKLPISSSVNLMFHVKNTSTSVLRQVSVITFMTNNIIIRDHHRD